MRVIADGELRMTKRHLYCYYKYNINMVEQTLKKRESLIRVVISSKRLFTFLSYGITVSFFTNEQNRMFKLE